MMSRRAWTLVRQTAPHDTLGRLLDRQNERCAPLEEGCEKKQQQQWRQNNYYNN